MSPIEFEKLVKQKAKEIQTYVISRFPAQAGNTALRFINDNFKQQGFQGSSFHRWKENKRKGRILVNKGHLRSANYYTTQPGQVTIKNTLPYAAIHNEGGNVTIPVTAKMRKFAWAMYYKESGKGIKETKGGAKYQSIVQGAKARKWKGLALTKKTELNLTIDQRQFAPTPSSQSPVLNAAIQKNIEKELQRIIH